MIQNQQIIITDLPFCEPYLLSACEIAAEKLGRPIEKGNWTTKGCYYYKEGKNTDKVYFSTNGTLDENKIYPSFDHWPSPWRPDGFDCKSGRNMLVDRFDCLVNWIFDHTLSRFFYCYFL